MIEVDDVLLVAQDVGGEPARVEPQRDRERDRRRARGGHRARRRRDAALTDALRRQPRSDRRTRDAADDASVGVDAGELVEAVLEEQRGDTAQIVIGETVGAAGGDSLAGRRPSSPRGRE